MNYDELRLECLRLAIQSQSPDPVTTAREFFEFVTRTDKRK